MSYSFSFSGHIEPPDAEKDAIIRKAARTFVETLSDANIPGSGAVGVPTGYDSLSSPTVHVGSGEIHAASATPTGHKGTK